MKIGEQFRGDVVTVAPDDTIRDAMWKMKEANVGAVVAVIGRKVVGILTDRDVAMYLALEDGNASTLVKHVMTRDVLTIYEDQGVFNATQYLMGHHIRRLPIVSRATEELVGMVTLDDLFALLSQELRNLGDAVAPALASRSTAM